MKNKPAPLLNPGTGYFDMVAYGKYNDGEMRDVIPTDDDLARGFATIPSFPGNE